MVNELCFTKVIEGIQEEKRNVQFHSDSFVNYLCLKSNSGTLDTRILGQKFAVRNGFVRR